MTGLETLQATEEELQSLKNEINTEEQKVKCFRRKTKITAHKIQVYEEEVEFSRQYEPQKTAEYRRRVELLKQARDELANHLHLENEKLTELHNRMNVLMKSIADQKKILGRANYINKQFEQQMHIRDQRAKRRAGLEKLKLMAEQTRAERLAARDDV